MSASEIDPSQFRQLLGRFATGVTILTVVTPDGRPLGMTANSLASVSLQPPLISVCVDHEADMHQAILAARICGQRAGESAGSAGAAFCRRV